MLRVLFVHSDPKLIDLYRSRLSRHFLVDSAANGLLALRRLKLKPPGLIVSSYRLPLLSGLSLLKYVRNESGLVRTPFMFLADDHPVDDALSFGASDWLPLSSTTPDLLISKIYYHVKHNQYGL